MTQFNLSEKRKELRCKDGSEGYGFTDIDVKKFIRLLKEEASDVNKHLGLHNVDECECCEKNWKCVYEILQIINKLAGDKLK